MTLYMCRRWPSAWERRQVCEWLRRHGIDPDEVDQRGWIETHPETRRITWLGFELERDENGVKRIVESENGAVHIVRALQLESPPMPFPVGISCVDVS